MILKGVVLLVIGLVFAGGVAFFMLSDGLINEKETENIVEEKAVVVELNLESREKAQARQIITLYDRVSIDNLNDLKGEGLCDITVEKEEIRSDEKVRADITFDASLKDEMVNTWCDQFERFGISGDTSYPQKVGGNLKLSIKNCDYGRVTVPTVYFLFVTSLDDALDYCSYPVTILPQESDAGVCHSEETIAKMKSECIDKVGNEGFTIPDASGCDTVYCGWGGSKCPAESLVERAEQACLAEGNTPARYSYDIDGQDWPCADVRCSVCPSEEELQTERDSCVTQGAQAITETDFDTNCQYVYCAPFGEDGDEEGGDEISDSEDIIEAPE